MRAETNERLGYVPTKGIWFYNQDLPTKWLLIHHIWRWMVTVLNGISFNRGVLTGAYCLLPVNGARRVMPPKLVIDSPCCNVSYYNYIFIWPYYIVIHFTWETLTKLFLSNIINHGENDVPWQSCMQCSHLCFVEVILWTSDNSLCFHQLIHREPYLRNKLPETVTIHLHSRFCNITVVLVVV